MVNLLIETENRGLNLGEFLTNEQDNISLSHLHKKDQNFKIVLLNLVGEPFFAAQANSTLSAVSNSVIHLFLYGKDMVLLQKKVGKREITEEEMRQMMDKGQMECEDCGQM